MVHRAARKNCKRVRMTDSISCPHRTGAAVDIYAQITHQNKKDAANALLWEALQLHPAELVEIMSTLPPLQSLEVMERTEIAWGRDAKGMTPEERQHVLERADAQSFRIADALAAKEAARG